MNSRMQFVPVRFSQFPAVLAALLFLVPVLGCGGVSGALVQEAVDQVGNRAEAEVSEPGAKRAAPGAKRAPPGGEITADLMDRFLRGLEAERDWVNERAALLESTPAGFERQDIARDMFRTTVQAALDVSGLERSRYAMLRERIQPLCERLSMLREDDGQYSVPGDPTVSARAALVKQGVPEDQILNQRVRYVYSPAELEVIRPRCGEIGEMLASIDASLRMASRVLEAQ